MQRSSPAVPLPPDAICGYTVLRSPSPQTYIALADGGRTVLLKPLDPDCLLHGQLHPSIKERLSRVRELALKSTANLHGVERDRQGVFLVWEFVEGESLESHARSLTSSQFIALMREVVLSVEALHQVGIVHGAIHARNIIITAVGQPRLTHISPLLFDEPPVDEAAFQSMFGKLIQNRTDIDPLLCDAVAHQRPLGEWPSLLVSASASTAQSATEDAQDRRRRTRFLLIALVVALLGVSVAIAIALILGPHR